MTAEVVIVGGGFAGLEAARALRRAPVRVTLVDRTNHHLFQPLLYQVATAGLDMADIAAPIRQVLRNQANATVLLGEVTGVDLPARRVQLASGASLGYDALILAPGAVTQYFGHDEWAVDAPGLKDGADALAIRNRILLAYEAAERERDERRRAALLTFVVIGGGPTGVELAGALADIARHTLTRNFRTFDARDSRIVLIEAGPRLLAALPGPLAEYSVRRLERMGVEVRAGWRVVGVDREGVSIERVPPPAAPGAAPVTAPAEKLQAATVLWAAGVKASPLMRALGVPLDRAGRVAVREDLSLPGHPEVFVIGDCAAVRDADAEAEASPSTAGSAPRPERWVPGMAPAAIQMGRHAARNVANLLAGQPTQPFRYRDRGDLATIGRTAAVARLPHLRMSGWPAWLLWVAVHIAQLISFRNRLVVLVEWLWFYITRQRGARVVITGAAPPLLDPAAPPRSQVPAERRVLASSSPCGRGRVKSSPRKAARCDRAEAAPS